MKNTILWIALCLSSMPLSAQYISIRETDQAGKARELLRARQAIDINSQLNIVAHDSIVFHDVHAHLNLDGSQAVDSLINTLRLYKNYIQKLDTAVLVYGQLYATPDAPVDREKLRVALQKRARAGIAIVRLFPAGSRFSRRREEELALLEPNKGSNESFRILMRLLTEEMESIEDELRVLRQEAGYYFQLAAWSVTERGPEPLHLEGFDDLPPGEFFEYERNKLYLTPEQMQELNALSDFFEDLDRQNVFDKITDILPGLAAGIIDTTVITSQMDKVKGQLHDLVTTAVEEKNEALENVRALEATWKTLLGDLKGLHMKYTSPDGLTGAGSKVEVLRGFMDDYSMISQRIRGLGQDVKSSITDIDFEAFGAQAATLKEEILRLESVCLDAAEQVINHARESYHLAVYGRRINAAALELSDKVLKLAVNDIPPTTTLDLVYTGRRDPGDLIVVKAMVRKGDDPHPFQTQVYEYPVMNALPHVHMSVAYTFAKPVAGDGNFKGGPLVSILYKFRSRSLTYRNFLDPGIGLHAASYDFNNDDTPEFAGGLVASMFKDYVQGGWGFNFNANRGYWFVGIRIPLPTMPVTMMGN